MSNVEVRPEPSPLPAAVPPASAETLLAIADALPVLISYVDADLRYQFNNREYEQWFGLAREELRGRTLAEVVGDAAFEVVRPHVERALAGEPVEYETLIPYRHAGERWVRATYTPDIDGDGRVRGYYALVVDISPERMRNEALRRSEERSRLAEAAARFGTWEWDMGERVTWSETMERIYGFEPGMYPGTFDAFIERVHPDDRQITMDRIARAVEHGADLDFEHRILLSDGSVRWLNGRGQIVRDADGKALRMIGIGLDVTERKEAEHALADALRSSQDAVKLVDTIIDSTPTAFVMLDREMRFIRVNRAAAEISGLPPERHLGQRLEELLPEIGPAAAARYREVLASQRSMEPEEISGYTPAHPGELRWWLHSASPVLTSGGESVAVAVIFTEITEGKRAEAALRESERRAHLRAEVNARLVSALDPQQILEEVAELTVPTLADICAIGLFNGGPETPRQAVRGLTDLERAHADRIHLRRWRSAPGSRETIGEATARGAYVFMPSFDAAWIAACAPDERQRDAALAINAVSVMCLPLVARGRPIGMVTFATAGSGRRLEQADLTLAREIAGQASVAVDNARLLSNLVETATNLRRANEAKDEFLSLVSHELKTPITMILGNAEVLERRMDHLPARERAAALADIKLESERLYRIIENLLALARIDTGQQIESEPIVLRKLIDRVVDRHRRRTTERVFLSKWHGDRDLVSGSADYLEQVLQNLIGNAEKYSPAPHPIEVIGASDGREVTVRVLDRGPGVSPDEIERLFAPFYRSERTSGAAAGVGIGLAVCKRLVEAQGGRLWAAQRAGGGAEFGFALPVLSPESIE